MVINSKGRGDNPGLVFIHSAHIVHIEAYNFSLQTSEEFSQQFYFFMRINSVYHRNEEKTEVVPTNHNSSSSETISPV